MYQIDGGEKFIILLRMNEAFGQVGYASSIGFGQRTADPVTMIREAKAAKKNKLGAEVFYQTYRTEESIVCIFTNTSSDSAYFIKVSIEGA